MMKKYDTAVFIGRFQPFHKGHLHNIEKALKVADQLILLIGSSFRAPSIKNPFSYQDRKNMIMADLNLADVDVTRIVIEPLSDWFYDEKGWINEVLTRVEKYSAKSHKTAIVGHQKDASSYYLKCFPKWRHIDVDNYKSYNATAFRKAYFEQKCILEEYMIAKTRDQGSWQILDAFLTNAQYDRLYEEYHAIKEYKKAWEDAPYAPIFVTTDALVICNEHILLIQRKYAPGKDLWALPGGFLEEDERIFDGIRRELVEESGIDSAFLDKSPVAIEVYDYPDRSLRGRTITHAGLFSLQTNRLPSVKGQDDAQKAKWFSISHVLSEMSDKLMDDHYQIIKNMLSKHQLIT
ncbi:bifunctional nicotinamide-nucleotide adenylyltransferase/Nudix hydroxylase [Fangia hongkongensis]|uniref:bifunctional nicotinamide-nucleotide adenylyltransferase/Nudix hydroxylase n=1 Tax=Fangia hongkongensis TaxID=270495 RepID=UPI00036820AE|nr:bifunctional nicotinamide-nucleotide adenylyltransferase/Nudix hydroxylase [Fangia hongkongensis]MBK2124587.1 bifunctional nicotinamide-nucleotide adenylyltransferase/Nudix hydroxylase [Fangia hongkongensis]